MICILHCNGTQFTKEYIMVKEIQRIINFKCAILSKGLCAKSPQQTIALQLIVNYIR